MKSETAAAAAALLRRQRVAALGTIHEGTPAVSMAPYAVVGDPFALVILVSSLSAHTKDMHAQPRVGLLIAEAPREDAPVHALARVSLEALARPLPVDDPMYARARTSYGERFPDMSMLFELGDFTLFALAPCAVRVVLGFAQAHSLTPQTLARAVAEATD